MKTIYEHRNCAYHTITHPHANGKQYSYITTPGDPHVNVAHENWQFYTHLFLIARRQKEQQLTTPLEPHAQKLPEGKDHIATLWR